jgi:DNA-binding NtrC family response regulator
MPRLLLVDDDEMVRNTLRTALRRAGHEVAVARNGREALRRVERDDAYDLVITDILMPEMEGIETILALKRLDPGSKVIAISGGGRTGNVEFLKMAQRLGAVATLCKPFGVGQLLTSIDEALTAT